MEIKRVGVITYGCVLTLVVAWIAGTVLVPVLGASNEHPTLLSFLQYAYGRVCHQIGDRSFHLDGHALAVCARCFGIYVGYLAGLVLYPFTTMLAQTELPHRRWLIAALLPVAVDLIGGSLGLFENTMATRSVTGFIAGVAGAYYTLPGLVSLAASMIKQDQHPRCLVPEGESTAGNTVGQSCSR